MIRNLSTFLPIMMMLLFAAACVSPMFELEGFFWAPDLDMEAKAVDTGPGGIEIGEKIDVVEDLGVDDDEFIGGRLKWFTGDNSWIRFEYIPIDYDSDELITRTFTFNGNIYPVNTRVITDLELEYMRLGWGWQFIAIGDTFKAGTLLEAKGYLIDASLDAPDVNIHDSDSFDIVLPTVGLVANFTPLEMLEIFGEASGISAGSYGWSVDAEAGVKFVPIEMVTIFAGYRYLTFDLEVDDDEADVDLTGPYAGVSVRF
ncbi:MAG: porin family protein [Planctomycetota bacterium]|jgi:hypothetical protein